MTQRCDVHFATWNVRNISTTDEALQSLSATLRLEQIEVCVITETHEKDDRALKKLRAMGWEVWVRERCSGAGAGVVLLTDANTGQRNTGR